MRKILMAATVVIGAGCPAPKSTAPIEYVGRTDPHPGVPVDAAEYTSPPTELPSARRTPDASRCALVTEIAPLKTFFGTLPVGVSEDAAFNAMLQFLVASGTDIETQDPVARTIITKRVVGQTWLSTCPVNRYFMYEFRIAITGRNVIVAAECWSSTGWEATVVDGVAMPRNRGELKGCEPPVYVSKNDATIPSMIFDGALQLIDLKRMTDPDPIPTPSIEAIRNARWWCAKLGAGDAGDCERSRDKCEQQRRDTSTAGAVLSDCYPMSEAICFDMEMADPSKHSWSSCHPTIAACLSQRRYAATRSEVRVTSDCHSVN